MYSASEVNLVTINAAIEAVPWESGVKFRKLGFKFRH